MKKHSNQPANDSQLIFERVFRAHYGDVFAYARRRTSKEAALDVVSNTFLTAWRRLEDVPQDALPWLLAVARRELANQARSDRRRTALRAKMRQLEKVYDEPGHDEVVDPGVLAALERLPDTEREAILLVAWEGLTPRQAATSLGCSGVAFRARLHRARRRLAKALAESDAHPTQPLRNLQEEPS